MPSRARTMLASCTTLGTTFMRTWRCFTSKAHTAIVLGFSANSPRIHLQGAREYQGLHDKARLARQNPQDTALPERQAADRKRQEPPGARLQTLQRKLSFCYVARLAAFVRLTLLSSSRTPSCSSKKYANRDFFTYYRIDRMQRPSKRRPDGS